MLIIQKCYVGFHHLSAKLSRIFHKYVRYSLNRNVMYLIWSIVLELQQKPKSILSKTDFELKFPFFFNLYFVFLALFKTIELFDLHNALT